MSWEVRQGDCVEVMRSLEASTFHAIVTDPPYHLTAGKNGGSGEASLNLASPAGRSRVTTGFMGQEWDGGDVAFRVETWAEALRVCKPGAHLLAFGGTRTYHRLACAIEDAGWEIRDCLMWLYGSGFPKSHDVSKGIDKAAGAEREVVGIDSVRAAKLINQHGSYQTDVGWSAGSRSADITAPKTQGAREWQGFGTALKPAYEPIILARKPLEGTVAQNVLKHGCGALDIDGSRISTNGEAVHCPQSDPSKRQGEVGTDLGISRADKSKFQEAQRESIERTNTLGRWPSNVLLDQEAAGLLDQMSGSLPGGTPRTDEHGKGGSGATFVLGRGHAGFGDQGGGASRFFYTSKAGQDERPEVDGVQHPTVKPLDLMRYLVGLVSREGDMVLEPFAGSGTTLAACVGLGRNVVACELNPDYIRLIEARMKTVTPSLFGSATQGGTG